MRFGLLLTLLLSLAPAAPAFAIALGSVQFKPCEISQPGGSGVAAAECARFAVAENPGEPQGRRIELAVTLLPARTAKAQPDVVTMIAGGPGQSAVEAYFSVQAVLDSLRSERHLLLIDQRGTGNSNRLGCPFWDWTQTREPGVADVKKMARDCLKTYEGRADARWYTTTDAVRDLESLRRATGIPAFNLIGGSYGTRVELEYLRRHPEGVRSVVLDGVVPPELALLQDHARNLDQALTLLSRRCGADAACKSRFGDPLQTMRRLLARLGEHPLAASYVHPRTNAVKHGQLTHSMLQGFIRLFSYSPEAMSVLPLMVDDAANGRPEALLAQIESLNDRLEDQLAHGMELSVTCTEDAPFLKASPDDVTTVLGGDMATLSKAQCEEWPRGTLPADFKQPVHSDKPVLILSGEFDPVTPARYGEQVLATLSHGRHLVVGGAGHIVMTRGCMPRLLKKFVASAAAEPLDVSCLEAQGAVPFFLGYQGPAP